MQFQFLHGTIKSNGIISSASFTHMFQFLHGTIKRIKKNIIHLLDKGFNSYMVRLRDFGKTYDTICYNKFQFLHGTIKRASTEEKIHRWRLFQFLHGTIKSLPFFVVFWCVKCFNSYMVRLRDCCWFKYMDIVSEFQFLHGTIKSAHCSAWMATLMKFQFLHGTIKRIYFGIIFQPSY